MVIGKWRLQQHARRGEAAAAERVGQQLRISDTTEDVAAISPEHAPVGYSIDRLGMILEVRAVRECVGSDRLRGARGGGGRESLAERQRVH